MPEIIPAMDVVLITVRRHELFKGTLPSKLFEAMGAGVPVILALQGEAQQIVENSNCGICVEPENASAMAEGILTLFRDPVLQKRLGENGRKYVLKFYNRNDIAERFERLLLGTLSNLSQFHGNMRTDDSNRVLPRNAAELSATARTKTDN
jgi:glycosyltransferase involved in cell wall biosynthesis